MKPAERPWLLTSQCAQCSFHAAAQQEELSGLGDQ